jgi:hypothetical protein
MKLTGSLFLLFLTFGYAHAEDKHVDDVTPAKDLKEYDVEIIIFEDAHARYLKSEAWNQKTTEINEITGKLGKLSKDGITATGFKSIKPAILKKQYNRMNASSEYKILFYGAWRQAGLEKNKAFEININDLKNSHRVRSKNTLTGTFKLVLARYLHIYNQLNYQRKVTITEDSKITATDSAASEKQTGVLSNDMAPHNGSYPLNSHRRMRSKELHYIDHPLVGMLIQINPVEKKKE